MRRALIFLALLLAGAGAHLGPPIPAGIEAADAIGAVHEIGALDQVGALDRVGGLDAIGASDSVESAVALRSPAPAAPVVREEGSGPTLRNPPRAPAPASTALELSRPTAGPAAIQARLNAWRQYVTVLALARAGRLACPTTAPPPFRFV